MSTDDIRSDCGACGQPQADHGVRYSAGLGDHTWLPDPESPMLEGIRARHSQTPATLPHTAGGGDRLPVSDVSEWIETTDPAPVPEPLAPEARAWVQARQMVVTGDRHTQINYDNPHVPLIRRILNATNRKDRA